MTEKNYIINHMGMRDLVELLLASIVKGAIVTAPLIAAIFIIGNPLQSILFVGISIAIFVAINYFSSGKFVPTSIDTFTLVGYCLPSYSCGAFAVLLIEYIEQVIQYITQALWLLWSIVPYSAIPTILFAWMLHGKGMRGWHWVSVAIGLGFGALLKITGIVLVIMSDTIGLPSTILAIILELSLSSWWLYNDLQEWVRHDIELQKTKEEREEREEFLKTATELAKRTRWM
jgi:hypothetical protein